MSIRWKFRISYIVTKLDVICFDLCIADTSLFS